MPSMEAKASTNDATIPPGSRIAATRLKKGPVLPLKPVKMQRCENCKHALVGKNMRCRCDYGVWADVPLDEMNWVVGQCKRFEAA